MVIGRFFNTIGPRQTGQYGMVVPRFVKQALKGEPITVYGDGNQSRCFTYVTDVVKAILALVEHPDAVGEIFNIGDDKEITINELAERVIAVTNSSSPIVHIPYDEAYEVGFEDMRRRVPDLTKIRNLIGYSPTVELDEMLIRGSRRYYRTRIEGLYHPEGMESKQKNSCLNIRGFHEQN